MPTPEFRKAVQVWPRNLNTVPSAFADLDGDRDLDAVFASMRSQSLVLINDGRGRFEASAQQLPDEMTTSWALLDERCERWVSSSEAILGVRTGNA